MTDVLFPFLSCCDIDCRPLGWKTKSKLVGHTIWSALAAVSQTEAVLNSTQEVPAWLTKCNALTLEFNLKTASIAGSPA